MSSKRKEYNNEPISVWQNLIFIVPMCALLYFLCQCINSEYESIENWVKYGFIIAIIYFIYVTVRGILTKNKNIKQYCCSLVLISIILLSYFFTIFGGYKIFFGYNIYTNYPGALYIEYLSKSGRVNFGIYDHCGENVSGGMVNSLKERVNYLNTNENIKTNIKIISPTDIVTNKRYKVSVENYNKGTIIDIYKDK